MTDRARNDLASMKRRIDALPMRPSERLDAIAAMRKAFIIVEGLVWLGRKANDIGAFLFSRPSLAR